MRDRKLNKPFPIIKFRIRMNLCLAGREYLREPEKRQGLGHLERR